MKKMIMLLCVASVMFMGVSALAEDAATSAQSAPASSQEMILFDFENGLEGWDVPEWAYEKPDHVQKEVNASNKQFKTGANSLEIIAEFPGGSWAGAIVEVMQGFDWTEYSTLACDIYVPADAQPGLTGKIILTVGNEWKWVEMSRNVPLTPGQWVTVKADLKPGSMDWRRTTVDDGFRQDVRKIDIRVESSGKPAYSGPLYIDNIRVIK